MRTFLVPMEPQAEEKLMGGILSLRQFTYLLLGVLLGGGMFFTGFWLAIKIALCIVLVVCSVLLAFVRLYEMNLDAFFAEYLFRYKTRDKKMYLSGVE